MTLVANLPRWLLLLALAFAPWAYGCTRPWAVHTLHALLGLLLVSWAVDGLARRCWPQVPRWLWGTALALAALAWWMVLNAKFDYAPDATTVLGFDYAQRFSLEAWADAAPGSYHKTVSLPAAWQASLLLGLLCFVADLVRRKEWRRRVLFTVAWTGIAIVGLGLAQRFTEAPGIFWRQENLDRTFFATYRYHANAGAFLNLVWPVLAGMFAGALLSGKHPRRKYWLGAGCVLCLAGLLVNTSRGSAAVGAGLLALWLGWWGLQIWRDQLEGLHPGAALVTIGLLVLLVGGVAVFAGMDSSLQRWQHIDELTAADNPRWLAAGVCGRMLPEAGWWGFGPGTFATMFPYFTGSLGDQIAGVWKYAHQDYLQTLLEWGYVGAGLWAVVIGGAFVAAGRQYRRHRDELSFKQRALHFGLVLALLGVLLHALVDFPLQVPSVQLYVAVWLGWLWGAPGWLAARRHQHPHSKRREARQSSGPAAPEPAGQAG